ncbi:hypothetical protein ACFX2I_037107 [Malus domestica]
MPLLSGLSCWTYYLEEAAAAAAADDIEKNNEEVLLSVSINEVLEGDHLAQCCVAPHINSPPTMAEATSLSPRFFCLCSTGIHLIMINSNSTNI